jgi:predicted RNase H-like HicB family nuclease
VEDVGSIRVVTDFLFDRTKELAPAHPERPFLWREVTFPDVPEAITQGETVAGCINEAAEALDEAIMGRINKGREIPKASTANRDSI